MKKTKKYILLVTITLVLVAVGVLAWKLFYPPALLPHDRVVIGLPFRISDMPSSMIPMGETIHHPKPQTPHGHPGIDFGWQNGESHEVVASSSGKISEIRLGGSEPGKYDVEVVSGVYALRYKEMDDAADLKIGDKVMKGDVVGHVGRYCANDGPNGLEHCWFNLHWELASRSLPLDRFCPVMYLDGDSENVLQALWNEVPSSDKIKSQFPDICSGDYKDKVEK